MPRVRYEDLKVGMVVAEDIFSDYGSVLVNAGDLLEERDLEKLYLHNIKVVKVFDETNDTDSDSEFLDTLNPKVLAKLEDTYEKKTDDLKDVFSQLVETEIAIENRENLTEVTQEVVAAVGDKKEIIKYISKMKQASPSIYTHSLNVSILCDLFGTLLHYPEEKKNNLVLAGLMHDIGKSELGLDVETNSIMMDELEPTALERYQKHSTLGYRILSDKGMPKDVCIGVLMHHEAQKGTGFPTGAKWDQIHEFAKIIAIANYYDHLTFSGNTQTKINPFAVIRLLENIQYDKFDIHFIATFLKNIATYYKGEWVELSTGEMAQIVFINENDLTNPIVRVGHSLIDLSRETDREIEKIV